jgi:hypothetical protein
MGEQGRAGKGRAGGQEENASGAMLTCPNENYDYGRLQIISRQDKVGLLSHWAWDMDKCEPCTKLFGLIGFFSLQYHCLPLIF